MVIKPDSFTEADIYVSPLCGRYCSMDAKILAGESYRWSSIRTVWLAVLETQVEMGVFAKPPSEESIQEFKDKITEFDWSRIGEIESELRHDVMANIKYISSDLVPNLGEVIHTGMTSEDATSNGEILQQREWINHVMGHTANFLTIALGQVEKYKDLPMLGETHLQPAAAVTLGKRISMWIGPIMEDLAKLEELKSRWHMKGIRGATGTYEALMKIFDCDYERVKELQQRVSQKLDIEITELVPGQTAHRSMDVDLLSCFSSLANNLAKMATDLRHIARMGEIGEPRGINQVGSSAMPWKQNPMKAERLNSIARLLAGFQVMANMTQQAQGLERTLDDSAGRRVYMPQSLLAIDACLILATELIGGLNVFDNVILTRLNNMLPFLSTEELLGSATKQGAPREATHHIIMEECKMVWSEIADGTVSQNNLLERLEKGGYEELKNIKFPSNLEPLNYVGASVELCEEFVVKDYSKFVRETAEKYPVVTEKTQV